MNFLVWASGAHAQQEPGQLEKRLDRPELKRPSVGPLAPDLPAPAPADGGAAPQVILSGAEITGSTVYGPRELSKIYEPYLGKPVTLDDVKAILEVITKKYRDDGYVLSQAVAPPQGLEFGILRIRVIEGYVARVAFDGEIKGRRGLLNGIGERLKRVRPMTLDALERYVLLVHDLPGASAAPRLVPIDQSTGAYELTITLKHDPAVGYVTLDDRGTGDVGPLQMLVGGFVDSAAGLYERTRINTFTIPTKPRELLYAELFHMMPLGPEGTNLTLSVSRSVVNAGTDGDLNEKDSQFFRFAAGLTHPVIRRRQEALYLGARFDFFNLESEEFNNTFRDQLRVLRLTANYVLADSWRGTNRAYIEASQGLDILGASDGDMLGRSRFSGQPDFTKLSGQMSRQQRLSEAVGLYMAVTGQVTSSAVFSAEEFTVGGSQFGRAYDPSEISGPDGVAGIAELQYGRDFGLSYLRGFQLYGFYDFGAAWFPNFGRSSVSSAGGGVRLNFTTDHRFDLQFAKPLTRPVFRQGADGDDWRVFFSLQSTF